MSTKWGPIVMSVIFALLAAPVAAQVIPSGPWGSINYWGQSGASQVLNPGSAGQCLETQGTNNPPAWIACPGSALNLLPSINTNQFYGNVSGQFAPPVGVDVNTILNTVGYDIARPPAVESILYKSNVGPAFNWQALPPSASGWILTSGGLTNPPFWSPSPTQSDLGSICQTIGALLYFDTPSLLWKCIVPGASGSVLQSNGAGANPTWQSNNVQSVTNDTNVTGAIAAQNLTLGWTGTLAAGRLNSNVVQSFTNDTNVTAAISAQNATLGWTGTLAAGRLNSNVVQAFTNDTNITASISAQNATLGWTGTLAIARGGTGSGTQQGALNNIAPTPTRAGDVIYYNGTNWVSLAGNNSGTQLLSENASGVPSWSNVGAGTVTEQKNTANGGITATGNCDNTSTNVGSPCNVALSTITGPGVLGATGSGAGQSVGTVQVPVLLATLTASASSTLSDTTHITSAYSMYELLFEDVIPGTAATTCEIQVHSGGTFQTSGYTYALGGSNPSAATILQGAAGTGTFVPCSDSSSNTNTEPGISGTFRLFNPSAAGQQHPIVGTYTRPPTQQTVAGYWGTNGAVDGFQVLFSSGTFTGVIKIYGFP